MSKKATRVRFWLVWNENGRQPTYKHDSKASAEAEAERLAEGNPDTAFFVLKPVAGRFGASRKILNVNLVRPKPGDDGIPF